MLTYEMQYEWCYYSNFIISCHVILNRSTAYSATQNHPFRSRFLRSREYDLSDKEDIDLSKDVRGTKTIEKNSSTDETNVENKINADNSVKR